MTKYGVIYCITNAVNGKKYVGQTRDSIERRWSGHLHSTRAGSSCALHSAMRKYGVKNFKIEQLDTAESLEELNEKEVYLIVQLGTLAPSGYNLTTGGEGFEFSLEARKKISIAAGSRVVAKRKFCRRGHLYDEVNTYFHPKGGRVCRTCFYLLLGGKIPKKLQPYLLSASPVCTSG